MEYAIWEKQMSDRVSNPFPRVEWAQDAYQNAAYMSVTVGYEWDSEKGQMTIQPREWHGSPPLTGSPGDVLSTDLVKQDIGRINDESDRLNLAWILGYMQCQLDANTADKSYTESTNESKGAEKEQ